MIKGVQTYTVRDFLNTPEQVYETHKKIADMGYNCVQGGASGGMTASETQAMYKELGLTNCSSGWDFDEMLAGGKAITDAVETANIYNTKYVGVASMSDEYRYTVDGHKRYAAALNKIGAMLKKEGGCSVMYHHHAFEYYSFGNGVNGMDILTDETDPETVLWTLDTHWMASSGVDPVYWIKKLKGRVPIIHFKDYGIVQGAVKIEDVEKQFAEVGEGNINWPPIVQACRDTEIDYVIVEQDICKVNPFDSLKISYDNLIKFGL